MADACRSALRVWRRVLAVVPGRNIVKELIKGLGKPQTFVTKTGAFVTAKIMRFVNKEEKRMPIKQY